MINLKITSETLDLLTWEQWELFDGVPERFKYRTAREIIALFMVDDSGAHVSVEDAMKELAKLKTSEMRETFSLFQAKITELAGGAINPQSGGG